MLRFLLLLIASVLALLLAAMYFYPGLFLSYLQTSEISAVRGYTTLRVPQPPVAVPTTKTVRFTSGTGFAVNNQGDLITNAHVVKNCRLIQVFQKDEPHVGKLIAIDPLQDIAVIHIDAALPLAPMQWEQDTLRKGEPLYIPGFPGEEGLKGRFIFRKTTLIKANYLATSTRLKGTRWHLMQQVAWHGNSGGPVLDGSGNVIGIITGGISFRNHNGDGSSANSVMYDRAVPASVLRSYLEQNNISYQQSFSGMGGYSEAALEQNAQRYILRVHCYT